MKKRIKDMQEQFKEFDLDKEEAEAVADLLDARDKAAELFGPLTTIEAAFDVFDHIVRLEDPEAQEEEWANLNAAIGIAKTVFGADHVDPKVAFKTYNKIFIGE